MWFLDFSIVNDYSFFFHILIVFTFFFFGWLLCRSSVGVCVSKLLDKCAWTFAGGINPASIDQFEVPYVLCCVECVRYVYFHLAYDYVSKFNFVSREQHLAGRATWPRLAIVYRVRLYVLYSRFLPILYRIAEAPLRRTRKWQHPSRHRRPSRIPIMDDYLLMEHTKID